MTADSRRRRLRRRIALIGLPFALAGGLFGGTLIVQHFIALSAIAQYDAGEYEESLNTSGQLALVNIVERWKPHYDMGTSYLQVDALGEAKEQFAIAMGLARPAEQCPIRANFAIAIEREGDDLVAAGEIEAGMERYREALELLEGRDPACAESSSNRSIEDSIERILEKLQQEEQEPPEGGEDGDESDGGEGGEDPQNQPDPDALDELEGGLDENRDEREDGLEDDEHGGGGGSGVDQPW
ncbi:hypothetical protein [Gulosibacter sp. 10]|uniref:hypothetical protein n=1 Tax=Gulosibacter sp. 10 TaxID=1255570 RepID=UPI00097F4D25|nr:hypothetical protein [Gulosibacter sp. 10]SJM48418.1 MNN4 protein [Gulosibacter sp. 10]